MKGENKDKKRAAKRKALRLANEATRNKVNAMVRDESGNANLRIIRADGKVAIGLRHGLYGFDQTVVLPIQDEQIAGACEDQNELASIVTKVGILALSKLIGYRLEQGLDGLALALAKWARIDIAGLKEDAEYTAEDIAKANAAREVQQLEAERLAAIHAAADAFDDVHTAAVGTTEA